MLRLVGLFLGDVLDCTSVLIEIADVFGGLILFEWTVGIHNAIASAQLVLLSIGS